MCELCSKVSTVGNNFWLTVLYLVKADDGKITMIGNYKFVQKHFVTIIYFKSRFRVIFFQAKYLLRDISVVDINDPFWCIMYLQFSVRTLRGVEVALACILMTTIKFWYISIVVVLCQKEICLCRAKLNVFSELLEPSWLLLFLSSS